MAQHAPHAAYGGSLAVEGHASAGQQLQHMVVV